MAYVIKEHGQDIAERYLLHEVIESVKIVEEYQKHAARLGKDSYKPEVLAELRCKRDALCQRFGKSYEKSYTNTSAEALTLLAAAVFGRGQLDLASAYGEEALVLWQKAGNAWRQADWLIDLSSIKLWQGEYERALVLAEESVALVRALGLPEGRALGSLASKLFLAQGDQARAASLAEQARTPLEEVGDRLYYPSVLHDLGPCAVSKGSWPRHAPCWNRV